eukprot:gene7346-13078_t
MLEFNKNFEIRKRLSISVVEQLDNIGDQGNINKVGKEDEQADKSMEVFSCDDDSDDGNDEVDDCDDDYDIEEGMDSEDDRNEVGNSAGMEFEGFKRCMAFLQRGNLEPSTFTSDRHLSITKHMREQLPNIRHYFDLWHLKKSNFTGMIIRHILAATHFNRNLKRELRTSIVTGLPQVKIVYPKFKNCIATVRDVRVKQNFDYVTEIFKTLLDSIIDGSLEGTSMALKEMVPPPMHDVFEKESSTIAVEKHFARKAMVSVEVPPTKQVEEIQQQMEQQQTSLQKDVRRCRLCKNPLKGHKNVINCPKNN